jgi:putative sterol carrier protein
VARFLSEAWFDAVISHTDQVDGANEPSLMLQQIVTGTPDGEVRYGVRVAGQHVAVVRGHVKDPDVTFTEDYSTAAEIARGEVSAQAALLAGRIRVTGNLATLTTRPGAAADDLIPPAVRAATTY